MGEDHSRKTVLTNCSTRNIRFERFESFVRRLDLQVGRKSRPDQAISIQVMGLLMYKIEAEVKGKVSILERRD